MPHRTAKLKLNHLLKPHRAAKLKLNHLLKPRQAAKPKLNHEQSRASGGMELQMYADFVFWGGPVLTVDANDLIAQAVAVRANRIIAVGEKEAVWKYVGPQTEQIDLRGRSLVPGLIDSHLHTAVFGANALAVDCRSPGVSSIEDIKELIREAAKKTPPGQWIRGWGYDHSKLKENRHPNRWDLDEAAPDHPVMLTRVCAHISAHNSKSLVIAGIGEHDEPPAGGEYERVDGKLSGVMFENAHMAMMKVASLSEQEIADAMEVAGKILAAQGITTVHDSGGYGKAQMAAIQEAIKTGRFKLRVYAMIVSFVENIRFVEDYLKLGVHTGFGDDRYRLGPIKLMIDGSSSGPTAATRKPYAVNPASSGIMSMEQAQIDDIVMRAHLGGWQMTCHAVGDRAVTAILDAIEKALAKAPRKDHRHRVEHCAMMTEGLLERVKALGVVPVPQPIFLYEFGDGYMVNYGKERAFDMFPCKRFLDAGIPAAGSSDCPITFSDPLLNMHLAVNRETQTGQCINADERVSIQEALRMFTYNGAYASFEEDTKGSIEVGKLADLVVLSEDLYATPAEKIRDVKADLTMIDGEIVYRR
jgi:predicted amidohydrolase YtcJ